MKAIVLSMLLAIAGVSVVKKQATNVFQPIAVVELFTSEGCSSCPPADKLLAETAAQSNPQIFPIAYHVNYWNRLGWADTFSTQAFTDRQNAYANKMNLNSVYTPQMVVNGRYEFIGSNKQSLSDALNKAFAAKPLAAFSSLQIQKGDTISVQYSLTGYYQNSTVNFALVALHQTTSVKRGENGGRTLNHTHVVRQLVTTAASAIGTIYFTSYPVPQSGNWAVIAFVQQNNNLHITGAAMVKP